MRSFKLLFWILLLISYKAYANDSSFINILEPKERSELWLNPGMYSYHYDKSQSFNNNNIGIGAEYRFSTVASVTIGGFKNSNSTHSNYVGIYWQPIALGPINIGAVGGAFNGYTATNNGGWFPAIFPALTMEGKWVGANVFFIPTVSDRVHGAISLQLKLKVYD